MLGTNLGCPGPRQGRGGVCSGGLSRRKSSGHLVEQPLDLLVLILSGQETPPIDASGRFGPTTTSDSRRSATTDHPWFLNLDAAEQDSSARQARRRALLASIAVHAVIVVALLGLGFGIRYRVVHAPNGVGPEVPQERAGIGGLLRGRTAWQGGCAEINDSIASELVRSVKRRVSTSAGVDSGVIALLAADSLLIRPIAADSLCQQAGQAVDRFRSILIEYRPRRLFLIRLGDAYLVVDTTLRSSTSGAALVLDSTLFRVLGRGWY